MVVEPYGRGGDNGMKKTVSNKALVKEAAFWTAVTKAAKENPGKVCHK
jgi:hypothetical protein